jgi:hypothetical protein
VRRGGVLVTLVIVVFVAAASGGSARAYVRTLNKGTLQPVYWEQTCPTATIYLNGFERSPANGGMSVDAIVKSITAAAHTWSADAVTCPAGGSPFLEIVPTLAPANAEAPEIGKDARNTIVFRTDRWSTSGRADTKDYDVSGLVITTVTSEPDGHIVDVDMEINATDPSTILWMNIDPGFVPPATKNGDEHTPPVFDLQNALTHEFGHFIGLAHTCFSPAYAGATVDANDLPRPVDDQKQPVPDCNAMDLPPAVTNAVMFYNPTFLETSKRTLSPDDVAAVCAIYAPSMYHEACALDQASPGCAVAPRAPARGLRVGGSALAFALFVLFARRRARRRRFSDRARARA